MEPQRTLAPLRTWTRDLRPVQSSNHYTSPLYNMSALPAHMYVRNDSVLISWPFKLLPRTLKLKPKNQYKMLQEEHGTKQTCN